MYNVVYGSDIIVVQARQSRALSRSRQVTASTLLMHGASPGRIDRKVEIPLPNESARMDIIKIHSRKIAKKGEIGGLAVRQAVAVTERISITAGALISSRDVEDYD